MLPVDFNDFFNVAAGKRIDPYPYQSELAQKPWPNIIEVPTGLGKTAAIILPWLYKHFQKDSSNPRRLVYCLPMRVLVEQTAQNANKWIGNLVRSNLLSPESKPTVHVLMGGDFDDDWDRYPENQAIIIGTQDMLLSRALNRGYATSRFRWPVQFGLINTDSLWVMDEIQLMGSGLATTAQLQAFRNSFGTLLPCNSVWMSATLQRDWLTTVDFAPYAATLSFLSLSGADHEHPDIRTRLNSIKRLEKVRLTSDQPKDVARLTIENHQKGTLTLVVINTVARAKDLYQELKRLKPEADLILLHSRFRLPDRMTALEKLLKTPENEGSICIATQVVEAGLDVSAATLITDPAPWASLVQRFGRCNRYGTDENARVVLLDVDLDKKSAVLPYSATDLSQSLDALLDGSNVGPATLPKIPMTPGYTHVIRRKDLVDLFDTTPDLSGLDIDISRFIRESEDHDCRVFWRSFEGDFPADNEPAPNRDELCSVSVSDLRRQKGLPLWRWDHLEKRWEQVRDQRVITPGMVFMMKSSSGGYTSELGWTGKKTDIPSLIESPGTEVEGDDDDLGVVRPWQTLIQHNDQVVDELKRVLSACEIPAPIGEILLDAACWHDSGKAHPVFQEAIRSDHPNESATSIWAKSPQQRGGYSRKGFRHELASALAMMAAGLSDLSVYLAAAHHGKIRLSIRSMPHEKPPNNPALRFARGVWEGDILPEADLGGGVVMPETSMDLSCMELGDGNGGPSWLARMIALRDDPSLGLFRLAFYEALLRAADWRASANAGKENE